MSELPNVALRLATIFALIQVQVTHALPKRCRKEQSILTCREAHLIKPKAMTSIANMILSYDLNVEFVDPLHFYSRPAKQFSIPGPLVANGLVISKKDSKIKWAVKHHHVRLWARVNKIHRSSIRDKIYNGIVEDLKRLIAKGNDKKTMQAMTKKALKQIASASKYDDIGKPKTTTESPEYVKVVADDLELIRQIPEVDSVLDKGGRRLRQRPLEFQTEDDLQHTLDEELSDIRGFLREENQASRGRRSEKRNKANVRKCIEMYRKNTRFAKGTQSLCGGRQPFRFNKRAIGRKYLRRKRPKIRRFKPKVKHPKKVQKVKSLYVFPYTLYAGGEFVGLFDEFSVKVAVSRDVTTKYKKQVAVLTAQLESERKMERNLEKAREKYAKEKKAKAEFAVAQTTPVPVSVLPTALNVTDDGSEGDDEVKDAEGVDDDDDDFDDDFDEVDGPIIRGQVAAGAAVVKIKVNQRSRKNSTNSNGTITGKRKNEASFVSASQDYDHRIKSFVVFFVAIFGILAVIAVLLIMAIKGKGTLDGMYLGQRSRKYNNGRTKLIEEEEKIRRNSKIFPVYEGIPDEEKVISFPEKIRKGIENVDNAQPNKSQVVKTASPTFHSPDSNEPMTTPRTDKTSPVEGFVPGLDVDPSLQESNERLNKAAVDERERMKMFLLSREEMAKNAPLSSHMHGHTLKRFNTLGSKQRPSVSNVPLAPFPNTQLGGRHVIVDFGKDKSSKGKDMQVKLPDSKRNKSPRLLEDQSSNNPGPAPSDDKHGTVLEYRERSLVSFLESIDSQSRGIMHYDHRTGGTSWS